MMYTLREKVFWAAVTSRFCVLTLSAVSNWLIPDHNAGVFLSPLDPNDKSKSILDALVNFIFGGLLRWDAQYFFHVAKYGYTYENCLAFSPLFPMITRVLSLCVYQLSYKFMSFSSVTIVCGVIVNFVCFVKSAVILYKLGVVVLRNEGLAYRAAVLFCFNPASIFFSAFYSESLYALMAFHGMLKCAELRNTEAYLLHSGIMFGLSSVTRSNGLLNVGFVVYQRLSYFLTYTYPYVLNKYHIAASSPIFLAPVLIVPCATWLISVCVTTLMCVVPFIAFQGYGYYKFCIISRSYLPYFLLVDAKKNSFKVPGFKLGEAQYWCHSYIPLSYSHVQSYYWDVGFLRYYQWKQIPNFLLAAPAVAVILGFTYHFLKHNKQFIKSLGLVIKDFDAKDSEAEKNGTDEKNNGNEDSQHKRQEFWSPRMFPYVCHAVIFTVFAVLCIHVQVTTRLIASGCPIFYWYLAHLFPDMGTLKETKRKLPSFAYRLKLIRAGTTAAEREKENAMRVETLQNLESRWRTFLFSYHTTDILVKIVRLYFFIYFIFGTTLFSNFYPWT